MYNVALATPINLTHLPRNLQRLTLAANTNIDDQPLQIDWARIPQLRVLTFNDCLDIDGILHDFWRSCPDLEQLSIVNCNSLQTLPFNVAELHSLRYLTITLCSSLRDVSMRWSRLADLTSLTITACPSLTSLPESLCFLPALKKLAIENCVALTTLPTQLGRLRALTGLSIKRLPALTSLPESLSRLPSVETLTIEACPNITRLPDDWRHSKTLRFIHLDDTGIRNPPALLGPVTEESWNTSAGIVYTPSLPDPRGLYWNPRLHQRLPRYVHSHVMAVLLSARRNIDREGRYKLPPELWLAILECWCPLLALEE